ncbi:Hypothetical predicted protein [Marmota monax]|uniref:Uncharacterized protein n=1 Tax=Marmota monax TaxID=9995 RepID=A0A5E4BW43_MARMO|nr:Hypothetical predicted protein [Marmota monax]
MNQQPKGSASDERRGERGLRTSSQPGPRVCVQAALCGLWCPSHGTSPAVWKTSRSVTHHRESKPSVEALRTSPGKTLCLQRKETPGLILRIFKEPKGAAGPGLSSGLWKRSLQNELLSLLNIVKQEMDVHNDTLLAS